VDQVTKYVALRDLADSPLHLVGPLQLDLEYNRGVAFSLGNGLGPIVIVIVVVVLAAVLLLGRSAPGRSGVVALGLIAGGALSNLGDRIVRRSSAVVDFIHTGFWPTFNVADSAVVIGSIVLGISLMRREAPTGPLRTRR
jgi:signal peptidase II